MINNDYSCHCMTCGRTQACGDEFAPCYFDDGDSLLNVRVTPLWVMRPERPGDWSEGDDWDDWDDQDEQADLDESGIYDSY